MNWIDHTYDAAFHRDFKLAEKRRELAAKYQALSEAERANDGDETRALAENWRWFTEAQASPSRMPTIDLADIDPPDRDDE